KALTCIHSRQQNFGWVNSARYLTFTRNPLPQTMFVTRARLSTGDHEAANLPLIQFPPSLLDDRFHSVSVDHSEIDGLGGEIETLKPRLSDKLVCLDTKNMILLINTLVNLGLAYHFEKKIEKFMKDALEKVEDIIGGEGDMYTISIIFRVFRRYGHIVSSGEDFS
ncbi:BnaCnng60620D, partial [Brassica napus]